MDLYYSIDLDAKIIRNNQFFVEEDAINEAVRMSKALEKELDVYLWRESHKIHYAVVKPTGEVEKLVPEIVQAVYAMESRGFSAEASKLRHLVSAASTYSFNGSTKVLVDGKPHTAKVEWVMSVDKGTAKVKTFKVNGVEDRDSVDIFNSHAVKEDMSPADLKKKLNDISKDYLGILKKYPLEFEEDEMKKFKLQ